ncbi:MAG: hypothetical protein HOP19_17880 [Acidobacteria bacterium]|nr:hypothetical protein [Acidobacteriota bacterium]
MERRQESQPLPAYRAQLERHLAARDFNALAPCLQSVLALTAPVRERRAFADELHSLGRALFDRELYAAAIELFRKAISVEARPAYYVNLSSALTAMAQLGRLSDYAPHGLAAPRGQHLFIACAPKSGSTFLKNALCRLTGYREQYCFYAHGQNEHDLYLPILLDGFGENLVTQQHCRAAEANVQLMQAFGIRPVVLVRNLFDAVISQRDYYRQGAAVNTYHHAEFAELDDAAQLDLLIEFVVPWYFQFFASWQRVARAQRLDVLWLSYEEMLKDKPAAVARVLDFYGLSRERAEIETAINAVEGRGEQPQFNKFNRGVAGRGQAQLSAAQQARIAALQRFYPATDFRLLGL